MQPRQLEEHLIFWSLYYRRGLREFDLIWCWNGAPLGILYTWTQCLPWVVLASHCSNHVFSCKKSLFFCFCVPTHTLKDAVQRMCSFHWCQDLIIANLYDHTSVHMNLDIDSSFFLQKTIDNFELRGNSLSRTILYLGFDHCLPGVNIIVFVLSTKDWNIYFL